MKPDDEPFSPTRQETEDMIRRRRDVGAVISILGVVSLFAMVYLFVPAENRGIEPIAARQTLTR